MTEQPHGGDDFIVADDSVSELDSTFSDAGSDTTSLKSSILKYHYENGRRYHAYQEGRYYLPNDEREQDHLDILHHMVKLLLDERLFLAPIGDNPQRILDLGCGTGIWAIEMGDLFPSAQVIGNDLSPVQPSMVPTNVQFEVDDIEQDWAYKSPFDFIHCQYMTTAIRDWPRLFRQSFDNLNPGGYIEFVDWDFNLSSDDGSLKETNDVLINSRKYMEAGNILGQEPCPGPKLAKWAEDTGFINVKDNVFKVPFGPWAKDPKLKEVGAWMQLQALEGVEAWSMALFTRVLGWSPEAVQVHLAGVRKDYKNPSLHPYAVLHVVYGQKPSAEKRE